MGTSSATFCCSLGTLNDQLVRIDFDGDNAGATSSRNHHEPRQGFDLMPWMNAEQTNFPHTVWFELNQPLKVVKFAFSSRHWDVGKLIQSPTEFEFLGSRDCMNWTVIGDKIYQTTFQSLDQENSWTIASDDVNVYRCYGVRVHKVASGVYTSIKHLKMWRKGKNFGEREGRESYKGQAEHHKEILTLAHKQLKLT